MSQLLLISADSGRPQAESFGIRLWSSLLIAGLFLGVSLLSSPIPGVNEPHYLTKARAFDDPAWCSRDFFLASGNAHYCFFRLTGPLNRWMSLLAIALLGRVISYLLLGIGWSMLGRAIGLAACYRILAAWVFAGVTLLGSFSGEWLLGGFESKVPAWGLALMAVSLWIHGQVRICPGWMAVAGVVCGLACSLHPVVGGWIAACICIVSCLNLAVRVRRDTDTRTAKPLRGIACFAIAAFVIALPGLIPALRLMTETSVPPKDRQLALFYQVFWRLKHHLDPTEFSGSQWLYAAAVSTGLLYGVLRLRKSESIAVDSALRGSTTNRTVDAMDYLLRLLAVSALIALAGVVIGWHTESAQKMTGWEWRASVLKFYPFRCFDGLLPVTAMLVYGRLIQQRPRSISWPLSLEQTLLISLVLVLPFEQAWVVREVAPAGYTAEQYTDWQAACDWIRKNTPPDALVLTPRTINP